ncbi:MAG: hypothetical protein RIT43_2390 [Bacteroidota bacterium]|jgi:type IX secretion system PorP/SprF family membrane protein
MASMKKPITIISVFVCLLGGFAEAQDAHFSQFDKLPMVLNPGLAGLNFKTQANATYRSQWTSINAAFNSIASSFDQRIQGKGKNSFFGVGLSAISDYTGSRLGSGLDIKMGGSGHIKLNEMSTLGLGIQAGLIQKTINAGGLQWGSQYDGNAYNPALLNAEGIALNNVKSLDAAAGIVYSYNESDFLRITGNKTFQFTTGLTVSHLNKPKNSFNGSDERLPMKFAAFGNSLVSLPNSTLSIGPSFLYQLQGKFSELLVGTRFRFMLQEASKFTGFRTASAASLGVYLRNKDALIAMLQYEISNYSIGFSYDMNISSLKSYSNLRGGFEISLRYAAPNPFGGGKSRI